MFDSLGAHGRHTQVVGTLSCHNHQSELLSRAKRTVGSSKKAVTAVPRDRCEASKVGRPLRTGDGDVERCE